MIANGKDAARPASRIDRTGWRIPALALEGLVKSRIVQFLQSPHQLMDALGDADAVETKGMLRKAAAFGATIGAGDDDLVRRFLLATVTRIDVSTQLRDPDTEARSAVDQAVRNGRQRPVGQFMRMARMQVRFSSRFPRACVGPATSCASSLREERRNDADPSLIRIIARAHQIADRFMTEDGLTIEEVAIQEKLTPSYVTRLLRLTFLAPDIIARILDGDQPPGLTAAKLMADTRLPLDWREQRVRLGIAA